MDELSIRSPDGIELAARAHGEGPLLLLVHGSSADRDCFSLAEPALVARHRVVTYDRRGRGRSADGPVHRLEHEVGDLQAVLAAIGPAHVVGHSFGAVCALLAAVRSPDIRSLVIYEPPLRMDRNPSDTVKVAFDDELPVESRIEAFHELCGISAAETSFMRSISTVWQAQIDGMRTVTREARALETLRWDRSTWSSIAAPTRYLRGAENQAPVYLSSEELAQALPDADVVSITGQDHLAFAFAPDAFATAVLEHTARQ